jgi:hypothetical protein
MEVGWTAEPVWTIWRGENSLPYRDSNSDPSVVQPVASHYTDYAIPGPTSLVKFINIQVTEKLPPLKMRFHSVVTEE